MSGTIRLYKMDCFYREAGQAAPVRRESRNIKAIDDAQAIHEAKGVAIAYGVAAFHLHAVSRKGDRTIYKSEEAGKHE